MKTFTSASAFPHASLQGAPSSDEVTSREIDELDKPRLLRETDKNLTSYNNSRTQHHLITFSSASAFPHATVPSAPSSDDDDSRKIDELDKPQRLRENVEKIRLHLTTQELSTIWKH